MANVKSVRGNTPEWGKDCFLSDSATLVGDVKAGDQCSFWFNTVVRGDVNSIRLGDKVNVQDGAVIHCTYEQTETHIGNCVSIGHNAIVHGCQVADNVLIGMGAIVMDRVRIGSNALIAAGAVVLEGTEIPPGTVYAGVPAKKIKSLSKDRFQDTVERIADNYTIYSKWYEEGS